jgi:hypothetical protein
MCGDMSVRASFDRAATVFEGQLLRRPPAHFKIGDLESVGLHYEFRVLRVWKGSPQPRLTLLDTGSSCSFHFGTSAIYNSSPGSRFLVFALGPCPPGESLSASPCEPHLPVSKAASALRELGPGTFVQAPIQVSAFSSTITSLVDRTNTSWLMGRLAIEASARRNLPFGVPRWPLAVACPTFLAAAALAVFLLRRRRHRLILLGATLPILAAAVIVAVGYIYCRTNPWFHFLVI